VIYFFIPLFIGLPLSLVVEAIFRATKSGSRPQSNGDQRTAVPAG
jgi:hypothetical protein